MPTLQSRKDRLIAQKAGLRNSPVEQYFAGSYFCLQKGLSKYYTSCVSKVIKRGNGVLEDAMTNKTTHVIGAKRPPPRTLCTVSRDDYELDDLSKEATIVNLGTERGREAEEGVGILLVDLRYLQQVSAGLAPATPRYPWELYEVPTSANEDDETRVKSELMPPEDDGRTAVAEESLERASASRDRFEVSESPESEASAHADAELPAARALLSAAGEAALSSATSASTVDSIQQLMRTFASDDSVPDALTTPLPGRGNSTAGPSASSFPSLLEYQAALFETAAKSLFASPSGVSQGTTPGGLHAPAERTEPLQAGMKRKREEVPAAIQDGSSEEMAIVLSDDEA